MIESRPLWTGGLLERGGKDRKVAWAMFGRGCSQKKRHRQVRTGYQKRTVRVLASA